MLADRSIPESASRDAGLRRYWFIGLGARLAVRMQREAADYGISAMLSCYAKY
jgi:hypothetical protein